LKKSTFPFQQFRAFSKSLISYVHRKPELEPFYSGYPDTDGFEKKLAEKSKNYSKAVRLKLVSSLELQNKDIQLHKNQRTNLDLLKKENTFTVSCGHQLVLGGGPAYFAYKILTAIRLAEELSTLHPSNHFIPVFWMASEDHDVEEVQAFSFFSNPCKIEVEGEGAVGRISTRKIAGQLQQIKDFPTWMSQPFETQKTIGEASRSWINHLFGDKGLLILDADSPELKVEFLPVLLDELRSDESEKRILETSQRLESLGYKAQIHPRNVNLFYLKDNQRIRLERTKDGIQTLDGKFKWNLDEAIAHFTIHPEELSPNVCLRPLYSQILLPDVAFIGGPAELAYWLQLKSVFELHKTPFPLLIPRFSATFINSNQSKKLQKLGLTAKDLSLDEVSIRKNLTKPVEEIILPDLEMSYSALINWAEVTDPTLAPAVKAELNKMSKMAEGLLKRIQKAAEAKEEQKLKQLSSLWEKFFPSGNLQERTESWLTFLVQDPDWINKVSQAIDPLDFQYTILQEE